MPAFLPWENGIPFHTFKKCHHRVIVILTQHSPLGRIVVYAPCIIITNLKTPLREMHHWNRRSNNNISSNRRNMTKPVPIPMPSSINHMEIAATPCRCNRCPQVRRIGIICLTPLVVAQEEDTMTTLCRPSLLEMRRHIRTRHGQTALPAPRHQQEQHPEENHYYWNSNRTRILRRSCPKILLLPPTILPLRNKQEECHCHSRWHTRCHQEQRPPEVRMWCIMKSRHHPDPGMSLGTVARRRYGIPSCHLSISSDMALRRLLLLLRGVDDYRLVLGLVPILILIFILIHMILCCMVVITRMRKRISNHCIGAPPAGTAAALIADCPRNLARPLRLQVVHRLHRTIQLTELL
jgi:hypothetical protein